LFSRALGYQRLYLIALSWITPLDMARLGRLPPQDLSDLKRPIDFWHCAGVHLTPKQLKTILESSRRIAGHSRQACFFEYFSLCCATGRLTPLHTAPGQRHRSRPVPHQQDTAICDD